MAQRRTGKIVTADPGVPGRLNSIGMGQAELDRLLAQFDVASGVCSPKRLYSRWRFNSPSVQMLLRHSSGMEIQIRVACRNLSCGGASVLHSAYVHTGSRCTLLLPRRGERPLPCAGAVVRCQHREGIVHELGIAFESPIRVRDFFGRGIVLDQFSFERVDPSKLQGCVLAVSDSAPQQELLGTLLAETGVRLTRVGSHAEALAEDLSAIDLILCDWSGPDGNADALLRQVRGMANSTPMLMVIPEMFDFAQVAAADVPAGFLRLPLQAETVHRALAEFMLAPAAETGAGRAEASEDDRPKTVPETILQLRQALEQHDAIGCYSLCLSVRDGASGMGLDHLAKLADLAALNLGNSLDLRAARPKVLALLAACDTIVARLSAA